MLISAVAVWDCQTSFTRLTKGQHLDVTNDNVSCMSASAAYFNLLSNRAVLNRPSGSQFRSTLHAPRSIHPISSAPSCTRLGLTTRLVCQQRSCFLMLLRLFLIKQGKTRQECKSLAPFTPRSTAPSRDEPRL